MPLQQNDVVDYSQNSSQSINEEDINEKFCAFCNLGPNSLLGQGELISCKPTPNFCPLKRLTSISKTSRSSSTDSSEENTSNSKSSLSLPTKRSKSKLKDKRRKLTSEESFDDVAPLIGLDSNELSEVGFNEPPAVETLFDGSNGLVWAHHCCAAWSDDVTQNDDYDLVNVDKAVCFGATTRCSFCRRYGASVVCKTPRCMKAFHYPCAGASGCFQDIRTLSLLCTDHLNQAPNLFRDEAQCSICEDSGTISDQLFCTSCGNHYHSKCLEHQIAVSAQVRAGWQCPDCKMCQTCRNPGEDNRMLVCDRCDRGFHMFCLKPAVTSLPKQGWKCQGCRRCIDCDTSSSNSKWHLNFSLCDACYNARNRGLFCPVCGHSHRRNPPLLTCTSCKKFVHVSCESNTDMLVRRPDYICPHCRGESDLSNTLLTTAQQDILGGREVKIETEEPDSGVSTPSDVFKSDDSLTKTEFCAKPPGFSAPTETTFLPRLPVTRRVNVLNKRNCKIGASNKKPKTYNSFSVKKRKKYLSQNSSEIISKDDDDPTNFAAVILYDMTDCFVNNQDVCFSCGSFGKGNEGKLLACAQCGQAYHLFCANLKLSKIVLNKVKKIGWRCLDCTVCNGCGNANDEARLLLCDDCDTAFHTYCLEPPLDTVPQGGWKCSWCVHCVKCGATTPGTNCEWRCNYSLCGPCSSLNNCTICKHSYTDDDLLVRCDNCERWLHAKCDNMFTEDEVELAVEQNYQCVMCRPKPHVLASEFGGFSVSANSENEYHVDGVVLTEIGMKQFRNQNYFQNSNRRRSSRVSSSVFSHRSKNKLNKAISDKPDYSDSLDDLDFDSSDDQSWEVSSQKKKPKQRFLKPGIGGFIPKQIKNSSLLRSKNQMDKKIDLHSPDCYDPFKKCGKELEATYPYYLQEAFFGKSLLESRSLHPNGDLEDFNFDSKVDEKKSPDDMLLNDDLILGQDDNLFDFLMDNNDLNFIEIENSGQEIPSTATTSSSSILTSTSTKTNLSWNQNSQTPVTCTMQASPVNVNRPRIINNSTRFPVNINQFQNTQINSNQQQPPQRLQEEVMDVDSLASVLNLDDLPQMEMSDVDDILADLITEKPPTSDGYGQQFPNFQSANQSQPPNLFSSSYQQKPTDNKLISEQNTQQPPVESVRWSDKLQIRKIEKELFEKYPVPLGRSDSLPVTKFQSSPKECVTKPKVLLKKSRSKPNYDDKEKGKSAKAKTEKNSPRRRNSSPRDTGKSPTSKSQSLSGDPQPHPAEMAQQMAHQQQFIEQTIQQTQLGSFSIPSSPLSKCQVSPKNILKSPVRSSEPSPIKNLATNLSEFDNESNKSIDSGCSPQNIYKTSQGNYVVEQNIESLAVTTQIEDQLELARQLSSENQITDNTKQHHVEMYTKQSINTNANENFQRQTPQQLNRTHSFTGGEASGFPAGFQETTLATGNVNTINQSSPYSSIMNQTQTNSAIQNPSQTTSGNQSYITQQQQIQQKRLLLMRQQQAQQQQQQQHQQNQMHLNNQSTTYIMQQGGSHNMNYNSMQTSQFTGNVHRSNSYPSNWNTTSSQEQWQQNLFNQQRSQFPSQQQQQQQQSVYRNFPPLQNAYGRMQWNPQTHHQQQSVQQSQLSQYPQVINNSNQYIQQPRQAFDQSHANTMVSSNANVIKNEDIQSRGHLGMQEPQKPNEIYVQQTSQADLQNISSQCSSDTSEVNSFDLEFYQPPSVQNEGGNMGSDNEEDSKSLEDLFIEKSQLGNKTDNVSIKTQNMGTSLPVCQSLTAEAASAVAAVVGQLNANYYQTHQDVSSNKPAHSATSTELLVSNESEASTLDKTSISAVIPGNSTKPSGLLADQPLLIEDLLEEEKREQMQKQNPSRVQATKTPPTSTNEMIVTKSPVNTQFPHSQLLQRMASGNHMPSHQIIPPRPMMYSQSRFPTYNNPGFSISDNTQIINNQFPTQISPTHTRMQYQQSPMLDNISPPPPQPSFGANPAAAAALKDPQSKAIYEEWLVSQERYLHYRQKKLEGELDNNRKIKRSLTTRQRSLKKHSTDLSEAELAHLEKVTKTANNFQKQLEMAKKQVRAHANIVSEYNNKLKRFQPAIHPPNMNRSQLMMGSPVPTPSGYIQGTPQLSPYHINSPNLMSPTMVGQRMPLQPNNSPTLNCINTVDNSPQNFQFNNPSVQIDDNNPFSDSYVQRELLDKKPTNQYVPSHNTPTPTEFYHVQNNSNHNSDTLSDYSRSDNGIISVNGRESVSPALSNEFCGPKTFDAMSDDRFIKKRPRQNDDKKRRRKKKEKDEPEIDATERIMAAIKQLPPLSPQEPELSISWTMCSNTIPWSSNPMGPSLLTGDFENPRINGLPDYYTEFLNGGPLPPSNPPTPPASLPPTPPPAQVLDELTPEESQRYSFPTKSSIKCEHQQKTIDIPPSLPTPPHNTFDEDIVKASTENSDSISFDFVPASPDQHSVRMSHLARYKSLARFDPSMDRRNQCTSPILNISSYYCKKDMDNHLLKLERLKADEKYAERDYTSIDVTLDIRKACDLNINNFLLKLAQVLCILPPSNYELLKYVPDKFEQLNINTDCNQASGSFPNSALQNTNFRKANPTVLSNQIPSNCLLCKASLGSNVIFKSMAEINPNEDIKCEIYFCSNDCYLQFAVSSRKCKIENENRKRRLEEEEEEDISSVDDSNDIKKVKTESRVVYEAEEVQPLKIKLKRAEKDCLRKWKNVKWKYYTTPVNLESEMELSTLGEPISPLNNEELTEAISSLDIGLTDNDAEDLRECLICMEVGDGNTNGSGRLLNYDIDKWVHLNCALWSSEVYETVNGALINVQVAYQRHKLQSCMVCSKMCATLSCYKLRCTAMYHFSCAVRDQCMFFKDKTILCPIHKPKIKPENELEHFSVFRRVYINRDEHEQIANVVQQNERKFTFRLGSLIFGNVGQLLPHQMNVFHTTNAIFPIGFESIRIFWSMRNVSSRCKYVCNVEDKAGKPEFAVTVIEKNFDNVTFRDKSPKTAWDSILSAIHALRKKDQSLSFFSDITSGEEVFGLTEPAILRIIESLPGVETCRNYCFKFGRSPLIQLPLAINPTGCARSEPKMRTFIRRPHTLTSCATSKQNHNSSSLFLSVTDTQAPYSKQFVHTKSSQYRKMKTESRNLAYVGRSRIQGFGMYAAKELEKGTMIIEYIGELIRNEVAEVHEKLYDKRNCGIYMFRIDDDRVCDATMRGGPARFINHSCNPNCQTEIVTIEKGTSKEHHIVISAIRKIIKGEELTYDYKFDFEDDNHKIPCLCGASNCRKWMN